MTHFPFAVNGVDFSALVHKRGYRTNRVPVYTPQIQTLDGVSHFSLIRTKGVLTVTLNPAEKEKMQQLAEELQILPVKVKYHSFQTGTTEEENMVAQDLSMALLLSSAGKDWIGGFELTFEQM